MGNKEFIVFEFLKICFQFTGCVYIQNLKCDGSTILRLALNRRAKKYNILWQRFISSYMQVFNSIIMLRSSKECKCMYKDAQNNPQRSIPNEQGLF